MLSFGVITAKDFVLGNFLSLFFLGDEERPSERFSREFVEAVLSQVLVVLTEHSRGQSKTKINNQEMFILRGGER